MHTTCILDARGRCGFRKEVHLWAGHGALNAIWWFAESATVSVAAVKRGVKLLPLLQPPVRARTDARTNPSAQRATQLRSVLARVYAVSIQNQINTTVP
jgi:hypothetical protein